MRMRYRLAYEILGDIIFFDSLSNDDLDKYCDGRLIFLSGLKMYTEHGLPDNSICFISEVRMKPKEELAQEYTIKCQWCLQIKSERAFPWINCESNSKRETRHNVCWCCIDSAGQPKARQE